MNTLIAASACGSVEVAPRCTRDVGLAVLVALQRARLISRDLQPEHVRVHAREDLAYEVTLHHADQEDAATFIEAFRQTLAPVGDPRYLVRRTDARLPSLPLTALWLPLRLLVFGRIGRATYHPVPDVLGTNRERAEVYAAAGVATSAVVSWSTRAATKAARSCSRRGPNRTTPLAPSPSTAGADGHQVGLVRSVAI